MNYSKITIPTLLIDENICKNNIKMMVEKAKLQKVIFRPHFKTHQSKIIGSWFKEQGVQKITVSSLQMAKYFASDWEDITIAFPANIRQIDIINELASRINLNLTLENIHSIEFLNKNLKSKVGYFIKIDAGYRRTGITFDIFPTIDKIIHTADKSNKLIFKGFLSHFGNTYQAKNPKEVSEIYYTSMEKLTLLKEHFIDDYPDLIMSIGDTPSCSIIHNFDHVDEIRPGNFVFYDLMQYSLGSCKFDQIAVAMTCPVVAKHRNRQEIIIYGGGVHFSKESILINNDKVYGLLVKLTEKGWERMDEDNYLIKLSQEHGTLKVKESLFNEINIGDLIGIIPVHSCLTANLMKGYISLENKNIDHLVSSL